MTTHEEIVWDRDHAASGWRDRAFVEPFELIVYDEGDWEVRGPPLGDTVAHGEEKDAEEARKRCLKVWAALAD